jgi:hypothetical protein
MRHVYRGKTTENKTTLQLDSCLGNKLKIPNLRVNTYIKLQSTLEADGPTVVYVWL